jgi:hypothetical protein
MHGINDAVISGCTFKNNTAINNPDTNNVYALTTNLGTCSDNEVCLSDDPPLVYSPNAAAPDYELCTGDVTEISHPSC